MNSESSVDFSLPSALRDFVFDLHDSVRRSRIVEDLQRLYEVRYKEVSEKYLVQSTWPEAKSIAGDVYNDEFFLSLYRYKSKAFVFYDAHLILLYALLVKWRCVI